MATHSSILGLENPIETGAWRPTVHRVTKSWTLSPAQRSQGLSLFPRPFNNFLKLMNKLFFFIHVQFSSVQLLSCDRLFVTP